MISLSDTTTINTTSSPVASAIRQSTQPKVEVEKTQHEHSTTNTGKLLPQVMVTVNLNRMNIGFLAGGLSARGDLTPLNNTWEVESMSFRNHAGLDYKVLTHTSTCHLSSDESQSVDVYSSIFQGCNFEMFKKLQFRAWGGPTNDQQPTFE